MELHILILPEPEPAPLFIVVPVGKTELNLRLHSLTSYIHT